MSMTASLEQIRADLPVTREFAYLQAGSVGPLPQVAADAITGLLDQAVRHGRGRRPFFERYLTAREETRQRLAAGLGTDPLRLALTGATTSGINLALNGLELGPGDEVITTNAEHPGVDEPLALLEQRRGVVVRRAEVLESADALDAVASLIGERTRAIALSHVLWATGRVLPLEAIAAAARERGALTVIDGAQSAGAIPLDLEACGADLYAIPGQKWLCGPMGVGALYVRDGLEQTLAVSQGSYLTRDREQPARPFWPGARRYDVETHALEALVGLHAALGWRTDRVGWDEGYRLAAAATERMRERLADLDAVALHPSPGPLATLVTFALRGRDAKDVAAALDERGVVVRWIPYGVEGSETALRASVGFWTSDEDLDRLVDGLAALA
jgi:L-cysteine/cystine lyase